MNEPDGGRIVDIVKLSLPMRGYEVKASREFLEEGKVISPHEGL